MKKPSFDERYEYSVYENGEFTVVDDLYTSDFAYAEGVGENSEERYEVRRHGSRIGRFESLEEAKKYLEDGEESIPRLEKC